jgi:hypothetical protein
MAYPLVAKAHQQKVPESAFPRPHLPQSISFEQPGNKPLQQVFGLVGIVTLASDKSVQRIPVRLQQVRKRLATLR